MKSQLIGTRLVLGIIFLLSGAAPAGAVLSASAAVPTVAAANADLAAFQLVAPGAGWALLGQQLFWTDSGGAEWREITPPNLGAGMIRAANFADAAHGWAVSTAMAANGELSYALARTADGGRSWQNAPLTVFAPDDAASMAGDVFLQFIDAHTGWLVVKQATSPNFSLGTLFETTDGGDHWARLSLPTGAPVHFSNPQDGRIDATAHDGSYATHDGGQTWTAQPGPSLPGPRGPGGEALSGLSMATAAEGWAKSSVGSCQAGTCELVTKLLATGDDGQTWAAVSLPGDQPALTQTFARPSVPAAPQDSGGLWETYTGQGFDFCDPRNGLPSLADMETWYANSPYGVWGLYLGGSSNHGLCGTLTKDFVTQLAQEGWRFIPTWVGPQAPCTNFRYKIASDPGTAHDQGVAEADLARNTAASLGLTLADTSGSVIYYDVEYYNNSPDVSCLAAVQAFISGWSGELRAHGLQAGVYGAPCGQSVSAFATIPNPPDMVWIARWAVPYAYNPDAAVLGYPLCGLDNSLWTSHQRLRQYAGGHDETWGGVTFNIDSDVIDAKVANVPVGCTPTVFGQVGFFVDWYFGGQCVLKSLGSYPTLASIGLPPNSITSMRVGPFTTVTVCRGEFYTPPCQSFSADTADLTSQPIGNDVVSSVEITTSLVLTNVVYIPWFTNGP